MQRKPWSFLVMLLLVGAAALAGCTDPQESGRESLEESPEENAEWPEPDVEEEDGVDAGGGEFERLEPDDPFVEEGIESTEDETPPPEDVEPPEVE